MENLIKVFELCVKINANTANCAFVNYSGHVDQISVRIAASKEEFLIYKYTKEFYLNDKFAKYEGESEANIKDLIENLEAILLGE